MKLSVIGCGYLGAVHAAAMASLGHTVVGIDVDQEKIDKLSAGQTPFFEPGLDEILQAGIDSGRLSFSTDYASLADAEVHFIGVGTPQRRDGQGADMTYVDAATNGILSYAKPGSLIAGKSTVPVGTAARLSELAAAKGVRLAWNPEFLREGFAVKDTVDPDRLVYGVADATRDEDVATLDAVYASILERGTPRLVTNQATAELVKVAANSFLATKISFINAMAEISEVAGADVTQLADAIGHDVRIGRKFLNAGVGFGGGCLPKDIRAFAARAEELGKGESVAFLKQVDEINLRRRQHVVDRVVDSFDGQVFGHRVAVLGLAFKPDSDDIRDSPALDVAVRLKGLGAEVVSFDPEAMDNARRLHPQLAYADSLEHALEGAEAVVVVTEWKQFRELDPVATAAKVARPIVFDGRNILDPVAWKAAGWTYTGMGR
ncbi:UDP-glucose 6-dehydrogenase [Microbacterium sorbitolivorans]|uniref:UDP-glucose 6-dehydrogenase n=1 Tax=Microbacterium sorbitolivorans TaxID=1867410 RepID=A0A367XU68_9MICO|nr:UDP-glucose/GDP-mannose dehydrogenase family protein [Microbacterium sorbitolivorans]RCK57166.1 UDP-glucose/GDP-mannose dehydrogenase family protein [Microbacterium sorbitolivorans]GGF46092.1 UDP-glucose 6-dehydrogenase [Microbacterium sorbitolivorans]